MQRGTLAALISRVWVYVVTVEVVRADGLEIAYERVGEGPPLVFVHGAAEDGRVWRAQLAALAGEFTVVAWDEPGAGRSSDVPADFGLLDYANCLAALIEALELGPAHVAGLSWGGTVIQELYRHHRALVSTLILIDTTPVGRGPYRRRRCVPGSRAHTRCSQLPPRSSIPPFPGCSPATRRPKWSRYWRRSPLPPGARASGRSCP